MKLPLFFFLALFILTASCHYIDGKRISGNGNVTTTTRSTQSFTDIEVHGAIDVVIKQDSSSSSVKVEADQNLQDIIYVHSNGSRLEIGTEEGYSIHHYSKMVVYVNNPFFQKIAVSGACNLTSDGKISGTSPFLLDLSGASEADLDISSETISIDASGACKAKLTGQTKNLDIEGRGATELHCYDLLSENATIKLSGAGNAEVFASVKLEASTSGAADVRYKGNAVVSGHVSGAGSIEKR